MKKLIDKDWMFYAGGESPFFGVSSEGVKVNLPHDFSIIQKRDKNSRTGVSNGFFPGGMGCYKKSIAIPNEWQGKNILLEFEGIYMNAEIRLNNELVMRHIYGYTGFFCDITPYVKYGEENKLSVNVNNDASPNSRWYSGSGIYRHVYLEVREKIHIASYGVFAKASVVNEEKSAVDVETKIENLTAENSDITICTTLLDNEGNAAASENTGLIIKANSEIVNKKNLTVSPAHLWSVDDPYLYTLKSEIICGGETIDTKETRIGIRSLTFNKEGFALNGVLMKLKGGCVHHDCGLLGSASYDRAEERKVLIHKNNGFNAIRCAHNPPSPAFLNACDKYGILVIDEAFDCWHEAKNPNDYGVYFDMLWKKDMASMLLRDRNHPSVIMWSTGNEILERDGHSSGYKLAEEIAEFVRKIDNTRAVTNALCPIPHVNDKVDEESLEKYGDKWGEKTALFAKPLDVVGYNYLRHRYEYDSKKYPNRLICGTETYPSESFEYWQEVEKNANVIGDFVWTSLDYFGESGLGRVWYGERCGYLGEYPWHTAYCGDFDICGEKRPQSYYRDCVWGRSKAPYIAVYYPENYKKKENSMLWAWNNVVSAWDFPGFEGKPIMADVYTDAEEVELFINGKSIGRKAAGKENKYKASFDTVFEPGEIAAVSYYSNGKTEKTVLKTAKKPAYIRLTSDRYMLDGGEEDLAYITAEIVDEDGNVVFNADNDIFFSVCGGGVLLAVGNADPLSEEMYVGNTRKTYHGKAMAVVSAEKALGKITVTAVTNGLLAEHIRINCEKK